MRNEIGRFLQLDAPQMFLNFRYRIVYLVFFTVILFLPSTAHATTIVNPDIWIIPSLLLTIILGLIIKPMVIKKKLKGISEQKKVSFLGAIVFESLLIYFLFSSLYVDLFMKHLSVLHAMVIAFLITSSISFISTFSVHLFVVQEKEEFFTLTNARIKEMIRTGFLSLIFPAIFGLIIFILLFVIYYIQVYSSH